MEGGYNTGIPEECLRTMESLLEKFGNDTCRSTLFDALDEHRWKTRLIERGKAVNNECLRMMESLVEKFGDGTCRSALDVTLEQHEPKADLIERGESEGDDECRRRMESLAEKYGNDTCRSALDVALDQHEWKTDLIQRGESEGDECRRTMDSLVDKFGITCRFARKVAFAKGKRKTAHQLQRNRDGGKYDFGLVAGAQLKVHRCMSSALTRLAELYAENTWECLDEFCVDWLDDCDTIGEAIAEAIILTFCHYNNLRLDRLHQNTNGPQNNNEGRWKQLRFAENSFYMSEMVQHPSIDLFQGISLGNKSPPRHNSDFCSEFFPLLGALYSRGRHDCLKVFNLSLCDQDSIHIGEIIGSNCLREVELRYLWADVHMEYIRNGFRRLEALQSEEGKSFSRLKKVNIAFDTKTSESEKTRFLTCLVGIRSLDELALVTECTAPFANTLIRELGASSSCRIEKIKICLSNYYFGAATFSREPTLLNSLCRSLESNTHIRDLEISFRGFQKTMEISHIASIVFPILCSGNCTLRRFSFKNTEILYRWAGLTTYLADIVADGENQQGAPSSDNNPHPSQVRQVDFGFKCRHADILLYHCKGFVEDIQTVLLFVSSNCFAYVYHLSDMVPDWRNLEAFMDHLKKCRPFMPEFRNGRSVDQIQHDINMVGVWLERNQVGRALLLPSVASTVPMALWSIVLEKAVNSGSIRFLEKNDDPARRAPWDGIFYLIQGLVQGGGLVARCTETAAARAANLESSVDNEAKRATKLVVEDVTPTSEPLPPVDQVARVRKRTRLELPST